MKTRITHNPEWWAFTLTNGKGRMWFAFCLSFECWEVDSEIRLLYCRRSFRDTCLTVFLPYISITLPKP